MVRNLDHFHGSPLGIILAPGDAVDWPRTPVERTPAKRFKPPFCPWRECGSHQRATFRAVRFGTYRRKFDRRTIPRFRCKACGRTFSLQTFACTYYLKKPKLLTQVAAGLVACDAARQTARSLGCSHTTVVHQANRIGRHALLLNALAMEMLGPISESLVFDHAETFQYCQEMPVGIGTAVGSESLFTYALDPTPHRLGGAMTPGRAKRLKALKKRCGELPAGSYRKSTERVLSRLLAKIRPGDRLHLITDGKPDYRDAAQPYVASGKLHLTAFPNPRRRLKHEPRGEQAGVRDRAMFPVDLLHKLIRHSSANHKRETIAHGRRVNAIMLRLYGFTVWRNFIKDRSERRPRHRTPAMDVGLTDRFLDWRQVLSRRLFPWRRKLTEVERLLYAMMMETPAVGNNRHHEAVNAF